jgi:hypothetical protein
MKRESYIKLEDLLGYLDRVALIHQEASKTAVQDGIEKENNGALCLLRLLIDAIEQFDTYEIEEYSPTIH